MNYIFRNYGSIPTEQIAEKVGITVDELRFLIDTAQSHFLEIAKEDSPRGEQVRKLLAKAGKELRRQSHN